MAAAAAVKESTTPTQEKPTTPIIKEPNDLKIVELGDEESLAIEKSPKTSPTSEIIPPPPPEFANETPEEQLEERSRKSSKDSLIESSAEDGEIKVQFRSSGGRGPAPIAAAAMVHQDVRRSISVDDKSSSTASSPTVLANSKLNTSTITINQLPDQSNSLASNINQVTVVTSHPPVIIDNSQSTKTPTGNKRLGKSLSCDTNISSIISNEVVIVSNETNKSQHVNESSTDDDYQSYDSLESSPKHNNNINNNNNKSVVVSASKARPRKLDESEVLIVSPDGIFEEDLLEENQTDGEMTKANRLDTSHVSVVTVGDEQVKVKDSSHLLIDSNSDLSNVSHAESSDGIEFMHAKTNGQVIYNSKRSSSSREDDVNIIVRSETGGPNSVKKRVSPDSSVDCSSSMDSPTRAQSETGSQRSSNHDGSKSNHVGIAVTNNNSKHDRSDAESISTTTSHDSREPDDMEGVQLRRKDPQDMVVVPPPSPKRPTRTKEEIMIANLKKKTRKRTRRFEIDGVQVTTTTSKVIYGDDENGRMYDDHIFRKQELRELKMLQKQEKKQFYDLQAKEQIAKDQQDKKFEQERLALERTYEADMDILARQHKQTVEKYEQQQENELRNTSKKIRMEQERELKLVRNFLSFSTFNLAFLSFLICSSAIL